ncbi:hypothetical protein GCM10009712_37980 [Pseudarthrobacter sulfonivorans]
MAEGGEAAGCPGIGEYSHGFQIRAGRKTSALPGDTNTGKFTSRRTIFDVPQECA